MAFTSAPTTDTYSTQRISLVQDTLIPPGDISFTTSGILGGMVNVLPFKRTLNGEEIMYGETRYATDVGTVVSGKRFVRGMYVWEKSVGDIYYFVVQTNGTTSTVYSSDDATTWTSVNTLGTDADTPVRFTEFIDDTNTKKLIMVDGLEGYVFTSDAAGTKITDTDFPSPHIPFPVFIDGYIFLAKSGTGDIYNSNLNDPTTWTAGDFISSELYPDDIQALLKINNYLLAIGKEGSEYFYDAAVATGSPLARYEGGSLPFGTSFPNSIACTKDTVLMIANNNDGEATMKLIEGFKHIEIPATEAMRVIFGYISEELSTASDFRASFFRQNGDLFYLLHLNGPGFADGLDETICFSVKHKLWLTLQTGTTAYMPMCTAPSTSTNISTYVAGWNNNAGIVFGILSSSETQDRFPASQVAIRSHVIIPPQNFGTLNRKFMYRMGVYTEGVYTNSSAPTIYLNDDQSSFWGTSGGRQLAGSTSTQTTEPFPFLTQLGSFRYRAIKVASTVRLRWYFIECDINKGQQ